MNSIADEKTNTQFAAGQKFWLVPYVIDQPSAEITIDVVGPKYLEAGKYKIEIASMIYSSNCILGIFYTDSDPYTSHNCKLYVDKNTWDKDQQTNKVFTATFTEVEYMAAVDVVRSTRNGNAAHLQRRIECGYNKAADMIERMESEFIVSPMDADGSRFVYPEIIAVNAKKLAALQSMTSVEVDMPDKNDWYLCFVDAGYYDVVYFKNGSWEWAYESKISHWQKLPPIPVKVG